MPGWQDVELSAYRHYRGQKEGSKKKRYQEEINGTMSQ